MAPAPYSPLLLSVISRIWSLFFFCVDYHSGFNNSINTFSGIVKKISDSRSKIKELKKDLLQTQEHLRKIQSRRRELGNIWLKGLEYKEMIKLLDQMWVLLLSFFADFFVLTAPPLFACSSEELKKAPQLLNEYMASKHYLHAVELAVKSAKVLNSEGLANVGALRDLRKNIFQVKNVFFPTQKTHLSCSRQCTSPYSHSLFMKL